MKLMISALFLGLSVSAFAAPAKMRKVEVTGDEAHAIYDAIAVEPRVEMNVFAFETEIKEVGGLKCVADPVWEGVVVRMDYRCVLKGEVRR